MRIPAGLVGAYTWDRSFRLWDTYFALIWSATLVFALVASFPGWPVRLTAAALLVPLIPLYVLVGRPILRGDPPDERRALGDGDRPATGTWEHFMIRIILADDHPVVREGLRAILSAEPDLEVVADAVGGPQAEALAAELRPDVVLMDLRMPGGDGVDSIERMAAAGLPCRVLVLTTYETDRDILRAVEAGAADYLLKDLPRGELAEAVRAAARGETVLAPSVAARLVDRLRTKPERPRLSERETAVLRLVAEGCTNAEIGRRLFIGESTVKTHLLRVFGKLGVDDRTAAVTSAMRYGLLDP